MKRRLKIKTYCTQISTRFMLEVSLDPEKYSMDFCSGKIDFKEAYENHTHDIYFIDVSGSDKDGNLNMFKAVTALKIKGLRRIVLITTDAHPAESNRMHPFGPLCFIEANFTRGRLLEMLDQLLTIRDTGIRVKSDPGFFDITLLKV